MGRGPEGKERERGVYKVVFNCAAEAIDTTLGIHIN
jgi:hypothetical protein